MNQSKDTKEEYSLINSKFMEEHSVIYWNLIWYFKRIGVDSCFLLDNLLNTRIKAAKNYSDIHEVESSFLTLFKNQITKPYHSHLNVKLTCMWDNLKLKNTIKIHEIPLYLSWLNSGKFHFIFYNKIDKVNKSIVRSRFA